MLLNQKRIFMAELDAGGNPAPAPTPAVDVPQAQGAAPALSKETADAIASAVTTAFAGVKDSIFAEARRTFTAQKPGKAPAAPADPSAPVVAPTVDPTEERRILRDFDRSLSKLGLSAQINSGQWTRAESALLAERPDNVEAWAADYFQGFGATTAPHPAPASQPAPAPLKPQNEIPASNRGGPPPSSVPLAEADILTMSESDRAALIADKGYAWFSKRFTDQLKAKGQVVKLR